MGTGGWIFLAVVIGAAVWAMSIYYGLVALRNRFKNAFAQIDVQLKRRYDGTIRLMEAELMRLMGAVLECPLPPLMEEVDPATLPA